VFLIQVFISERFPNYLVFLSLVAIGALFLFFLYFIDNAEHSETYPYTFLNGKLKIKLKVYKEIGNYQLKADIINLKSGEKLVSPNYNIVLRGKSKKSVRDFLDEIKKKNKKKYYSFLDLKDTVKVKFGEKEFRIFIDPYDPFANKDEPVQYSVDEAGVSLLRLNVREKPKLLYGNLSDINTWIRNTIKYPGINKKQRALTITKYKSKNMTEIKPKVVFILGDTSYYKTPPIITVQFNWNNHVYTINMRACKRKTFLKGGEKACLNFINSEFLLKEISDAEIKKYFGSEKTYKKVKEIYSLYPIIDMLNRSEKKY
jgi:hypothetical protein